MLLLSNHLLKGWKQKCIRTIVIIAVIFAGFYFLLKPLPLEQADIDLRKIFAILFAFTIGMSFFAYLIHPWLVRFSVLKYKIDEKGITVKSPAVRLYHWKHITSCHLVEPDEMPEGVFNVIFTTRLSPRPKLLVFDLSQQNLAEEICQYITEKIASHSRTANVKSRLRPTRQEHYCLFAGSLIGAFVLTFSIFPWYIKNLKENGPAGAFSPVIALIIVLALGPGTWAILSLYGQKTFRFRDWPAWILFYNYIALLLTLIFLILVFIFKLRKTFEGY